MKLKCSFVICIGLPASGKSTWLKRWGQPADIVTLSTDDLIEAEARRVGKTYDEGLERLYEHS